MALDREVKIKNHKTMNMQTLDLNRMGLETMSNYEMQTTDGGDIWGRIAGFVGVAVSQAAIVVGAMTFQPELIYMGAVGTGLSLDYMSSQ